MNSSVARPVVLGMALGLSLIAGAATSAGEAVWYGAIEIGADGVKSIAVPINESGAPDLTRMIKDSSRRPGNGASLGDLAAGGEFRQPAIDQARAAVAGFHAELSGNRNIPPERLWIVTGGGLLSRGRPKNFESLKRAVLAATGGDEALIEIEPKRGDELLMRGAIPRERLGDSILLDVGPATSKLGYREPEAAFSLGRFVFTPSRMDGVESFRNSIRAEMTRSGRKDFAGFREVAAELRPGVDAKIVAETVRRAAYLNRTTVILLGDISGAIGLLVDPERMLEEDLYFEFRLDQLREFRRGLAQSGKVPVPDLADLPEQTRRQATNEVNRALEQFTAEDFLAGSEVLLGFAEVLQWGEQKKKVYFVKSGVIAWIVALVEEARAK